MRRIKYLGLALVAVLSIGGGAGAASASAGYFETENQSSAALEGDPAGTPVQLTFPNGHQYNCSPAALGGEFVGFGEELRPTITQSQECTMGASIAMNGCSFAFRVGEETGANVYQGELDIVNAPGLTCTGIKIEVSPSCKYTVGTESEAQGVAIREDKGSATTLTVDVDEFLPITPEVKTSLCRQETVLYKAEWDVAAYQWGESPTNLMISGGEIDEIKASSYPHTITGSQASGEDALLLTLSSSRKFSCGSVSFGGTLSGASPSVTTVPSQSGCTSNTTQPATIGMNSCSYVFDIAGSKMDVGCVNEGDGITLTVYRAKQNRMKASHSASTAFSRRTMLWAQAISTTATLAPWTWD